MIFNYLILKNRFVTYADIVCRIKISEDIGLHNCSRIQEVAQTFVLKKKELGLSARFKGFICIHIEEKVQKLPDSLLV